MPVAGWSDVVPTVNKKSRFLLDLTAKLPVYSVIIKEIKTARVGSERDEVASLPSVAHYCVPERISFRS